MNSAQLLALNIQEVRRRSLIVWRAIPDNMLSWKVDDDAMSLGESVRHTWESLAYYAAFAKAGRSCDVEIVGADESIVNIGREIELAQSSLKDMLDFVNSLSESDLERQIDRSDVGYVRSLGDFLMRAAYHEAVHTGQLLQAMRQANILRPKIWD